MKEKLNGNGKTKSKRIMPLTYFFILLINFIILFCIGLIYTKYEKNNKKQLFNENLHNVNNLNYASANSAYTYTNDMKIKIEDTCTYITINNMTKEEVITYLCNSNTNKDRKFQLILSGSYGNTGELRFGEYSGVSIRVPTENEKNRNSTIMTPIVYGSGYYNLFPCFTDIQDINNGNLCFTPEFTDPDTKKKNFGVYRHLILKDNTNAKKLYTLLLLVNSETALNSYNQLNKFNEQSFVLINNEGFYIIKNNDYRNANFFDYIVNYNGLSLDKKQQIQAQVFLQANTTGNSCNLFYKNHRGNECVFSITPTANGWYSISCVPISAFNLKSNDTNFSLIIILFFITLFVIDGIIVFNWGKALNYNISVAETAMQEAKQASLSKSRFLSTMSHELRTPLNAIIGFAALSQDSLNNPTQLNNYLRKIEISSKLLLQLISDILDISAIESSKIKLNYNPFNLGRIITSLTSIYYDQCYNKHIEFNVILKNIHQETIIGDSVRLNQILLNFLSNAVKFTPDGGKIEFKIEVSKRNDEYVYIKFIVTDNGCGISNELKSRLFKPFERASGENAVKFNGTGLGLSIAKNITELMGGTVGVESTEGLGSVFWAEIPFKSVIKSEQNSVHPIKGFNIVLAVKNDEEREYIGQILENFSISYTPANSVEQAFNLLKTNKDDVKPFNLCILDWKLSDVEIVDAVKRIRNAFSKEILKILVLSYDLAKTQSQCIEAGADFIFYKPVFSSSLYNALEEISSKIPQYIPTNTKKYNLKGKRILLAEDNEMNIEYAKEILSKFNLEVIITKNGEDAFKIFTNSIPGYFQLILMDIQMPIMNGYESTEAIRNSNHPDALKIPIIAMTADTFSEDIEKARKSNMNEHVAKPIEPDDLYRVLEKYLNI